MRSSSRRYGSGEGERYSCAATVSPRRRFVPTLCLKIFLAGTMAFLTVPGSPAQGIPEPDLVLYGVIKNVRSNANLRLGYGTLTWTLQPVGGGAPVVATTVLTNINDQFSYILRVPCESPAFGFSAGSNTVQLTSAGFSFDRSQVTWITNALSFVQPMQTNVFLKSTDRGRIERIDLNVSMPVVYDVNGLPVDWELLYFGHTGIDPLADPDGDGMNNFAEYRAGTNPEDALSALRFTEVRQLQGGVRLKWLSAPDRAYALQRSATPAGGFVDIQTGIAATAYENMFLDTNASGAGPYIYRLRMDDLYSVPTSSAFSLVNIRRDPLGGISIDWQSTAGRSYAVQRSASVAAGYVDIATGLTATPPVNTFRDATATDNGPFFYRLRLEGGFMSAPMALKNTRTQPEFADGFRPEWLNQVQKPYTSQRSSTVPGRYAPAGAAEMPAPPASFLSQDSKAK